MPDAGSAANAACEPATIRKPAAPSASNADIATTRRRPDAAPSSGTSTSQIAAKELMPPELAATTVTTVVSANAESTWALS